ncbi:MAG: hypothetical protein H6708_30840 [Kofleriaceae bacterium]|nr:hypothetical protein [Kofleriaceae bacterium]
MSRPPATLIWGLAITGAGQLAIDVAWADAVGRRAASARDLEAITATLTRLSMAGGAVIVAGAALIAAGLWTLSRQVAPARGAPLRVAAVAAVAALVAHAGLDLVPRLWTPIVGPFAASPVWITAGLQWLLAAAAVTAAVATIAAGRGARVVVALAAPLLVTCLIAYRAPPLSDAIYSWLVASAGGERAARWPWGLIVGGSVAVHAAVWWRVVVALGRDAVAAPAAPAAVGRSLGVAAGALQVATVAAGATVLVIVGTVDGAIQVVDAGARAWLWCAALATLTTAVAALVAAGALLGADARLQQAVGARLAAGVALVIAAAWLSLARGVALGHVAAGHPERVPGAELDALEGALRVGLAAGGALIVTAIARWAAAAGVGAVR